MLQVCRFILTLYALFKPRLAPVPSFPLSAAYLHWWQEVTSADRTVAFLLRLVGGDKCWGLPWKYCGKYSGNRALTQINFSANPHINQKKMLSQNFLSYKMYCVNRTQTDTLDSMYASEDIKRQTSFDLLCNNYLGASAFWQLRLLCDFGETRLYLKKNTKNSK